MTVLGGVTRWRRAAATTLSALAVAVGLVLGSIPPTANADVLDTLEQEFTTASGAGQVAGLLNQALKLRASGIKPTKAQLANIQHALDYRPNLKPLISALQETVSDQNTRLQQAQAIASSQGPTTIGINQYDPTAPGGITAGPGGINIGGGGWTIGDGRNSGPIGPGR